MNSIHDPVCPTYPATPRRPAANGYVCYLPHPSRYTNSARSYPGFGDTPEEAAKAACYWANQAPHTVIVPASRAPRWTLEQVGTFWSVHDGRKADGGTAWPAKIRANTPEDALHAAEEMARRSAESYRPLASDEGCEVSVTITVSSCHGWREHTFTLHLPPRASVR